MVFLTMSTPLVLSKYTGTCGSYAPECIGDTQRMLFYTALALIAVGTAGKITSLSSFFGEQLDSTSTTARSIASAFPVNIAPSVVTMVAVLGLPYIKPWSLRFGIPTICFLVATLIFLSGSRTYSYVQPQGSHLTMVFRVLVASASKKLHQHPADNELYGMRNCPIPRTHHLRCLDKAALILPNQSLEQQNNRWRLCAVSEVEVTKLIITLIPMTLFFIFYGLITALVYTYFVEQAKNLNNKVGSLTIPLTILFWSYGQGRTYYPKFHFRAMHWLCGINAQSAAPLFGFLVSMILGVLCCFTAAKVESHRLDVVKSHGLVDKPDERIPFSVFWLLPQFVLLGAVDGLFAASAESFFGLYLTTSFNAYMIFFGSVVDGFGHIGSILLVHIVGKASERGGMRPSWFQDTLNKSRLDNYYLFLACLCGINIVLYMVMRRCYAIYMV